MNFCQLDMLISSFESDVLIKISRDNKEIKLNSDCCGSDISSEGHLQLKCQHKQLIGDIGGDGADTN